MISCYDTMTCSLVYFQLEEGSLPMIRVIFLLLNISRSLLSLFVYSSPPIRPRLRLLTRVGRWCRRRSPRQLMLNSITLDDNFALYLTYLAQINLPICNRTFRISNRSQFLSLQLKMHIIYSAGLLPIFSFAAKLFKKYIHKIWRHGKIKAKYEP